MITFEKAIENILKHTQCLPKTSVTLVQSLGYVLAETIKAKEPIPRFNSSAVDGYAVRFEDIKNASYTAPKLLPIIGEVKAGDTVIPILRKGFAIKIFTGAVVPQNANALVMQEFTAEKNRTVSIFRKVRKGENIRRHGQEFRKNQIVLKRGTLITPPVVGMLATLGYSSVRVTRKPCVGLIITGNELRNPGVKLQTGEIYDSNSFALTAALQSHGINPVTVKILKDNKRFIKSALEKTIALSDVVITVGGVSVGEYDLVKEIFTELDVKKIFWKVAMKPGKPNYFGTLDKKLIFGLPGNPVAALVSFHLLVMPAIRKLMGDDYKKEFYLNAKITSDLKKKPGRLEFVRGIVSTNRFDELVVTPTKGQDSHMIGGLANANCLIHFPKEENFISKGSIVKVELMNWDGAKSPPEAEAMSGEQRATNNE